MIEIDEGMTNVSRQFLPEWSDCSEILDGSTSQSCFDNERATIHFEDAFGFFLEEFGEDDSDDVDYDTNDDKDDEELFSAIIMDALDPDDVSLFEGQVQLYPLIVTTASYSNLSTPKTTTVWRLR